MYYNYDDGKERIKKILNNATEIIEKELPKDDSEFTYDNGIKCWIGSIFVDIIKSSDIIEKEKDIEVSKILRSFSSEIIAIMNSSNNVREIGVRGDCVYGIYATPKQYDVYELSDIAAYINTCIKMINKLLDKKGYRNISVGIGVSIGEDLVVKAGQKGTGINDRIWIGKAVVKACNLASIAGRNGKKKIGFSSIAYSNFIDKLVEHNSNAKSWFDYDRINDAYFTDIIITEFNTWIDNNI